MDIEDQQIYTENTPANQKELVVFHNLSDKGDEEKKKVTPSNKSSLQVARIENKKPVLRLAGLFNPPKFIEPTKVHVLFGDICIYDSVRTENIERDELGIMQVYNLNKRYQQVIWDEKCRVLSIHSEGMVGETENWIVAISRLRTLGTEEAKLFADRLELHCKNTELANLNSKKIWMEIDQQYNQARKDIRAGEIKPLLSFSKSKQPPAHSTGT
jgi:hypothetical protein